MQSIGEKHKSESWCQGSHLHGKVGARFWNFRPANFLGRVQGVFVNLNLVVDRKDIQRVVVVGRNNLQAKDKERKGGVGRGEPRGMAKIVCMLMRDPWSGVSIESPSLFCEMTNLVRRKFVCLGTLVDCFQLLLNAGE